MTFEEANALLDEVLAFLLSCGGPYVESTAHLETLLMFCLGSGQYVMDRDENGIRWFANWIRIGSDDMPGIRVGVYPIDMTTGENIYICDAASKVGAKDMVRTLRGINYEKAFWHRGNIEKTHGGNHGK